MTIQHSFNIKKSLSLLGKVKVSGGLQLLTKLNKQMTEQPEVNSLVDRILNE